MRLGGISPNFAPVKNHAEETPLFSDSYQFTGHTSHRNPIPCQRHYLLQSKQTMSYHLRLAICVKRLDLIGQSRLEEIKIKIKILQHNVSSGGI